MDQRWNDLAEAVRTQRDLLGLRQKDMAHEGGPSYETMRLIERGTPPPSGAYQSRTITGLEKALRWKPGTVQNILNGAAGNDPAAWVDDTPRSYGATVRDAAPATDHIGPPPAWIKPASVGGEVRVGAIAAHATGSAHDAVGPVSLITRAGMDFIDAVQKYRGTTSEATEIRQAVLKYLQGLLQDLTEEVE